jgi:hypothetical protein
MWPDEWRQAYPNGVAPPLVAEPDGLLGAATGIALGIALGLAAWALIGAAVWLVVH